MNFMRSYVSYSNGPDFKAEVKRWQRIEAAAKSLLEKYRTQELDVPELTEPINDLVWAMSNGNSDR